MHLKLNLSDNAFLFHPDKILCMTTSTRQGVVPLCLRFPSRLPPLKTSLSRTLLTTWTEAATPFQRVPPLPTRGLPSPTKPPISAHRCRPVPPPRPTTTSTRRRSTSLSRRASPPLQSLVPLPPLSPWFPSRTQTANQPRKEAHLFRGSPRTKSCPLSPLERAVCRGRSLT